MDSIAKAMLDMLIEIAIGGSVGKDTCVESMNNGASVNGKPHIARDFSNLQFPFCVQLAKVIVANMK